MLFIYLFHFIQSVGILTTTIAAGYDIKYLVWIGIALNILASLINIYEKTNNSILKKLMLEIKKIKDGNYIGEDELVENQPQNDNSSQTSNEGNKKINIISDNNILLGGNSIKKILTDKI